MESTRRWWPVIAATELGAKRGGGRVSFIWFRTKLTVPAEVKIAPGYWTATLHFAVPYVEWGIKNPSTLFLRVSESVDIDLTTSGNLTQP